MVDIDEQKKEATIAENDTVTITCGASSQVYSDVLWIFNRKPLTGNDSRCTSLLINSELLQRLVIFNFRIQAYKYYHSVFK